MRGWYQRKTPEERRAWAAKRNREPIRARDRERAKTPERRAENTRVSRAWRQRYPERARAHSAVAYAIRTGKLERGPCEREGEGTCNGKIHAHHDDYSKPLEVRWLCALHHGEERRDE